MVEVIDRIRRMEEYYNALLEAVRTDPESVEREPGLREMLAELMGYYDGGQWLEDYRLDEQGLLPRDLNRGVLSEDGVYNLLSDLPQTERKHDPWI